eukprot:15468958-Alexandrium_andersonii.AAC.1
MQAAAVGTFLNTARHRLRHFGVQAVPALSLLVPVARVMAAWGVHLLADRLAWAPADAPQA